MERKGSPLNKVELKFLSLPGPVQQYINLNARVQSMADILPTAQLRELAATRDRYYQIVHNDKKLQESFYEFVEFRNMEDQKKTEVSN